MLGEVTRGLREVTRGLREVTRGLREVPRGLREVTRPQSDQLGLERGHTGLYGASGDCYGPEGVHVRLNSDIICGPRGHWGYKERLSGASVGPLVGKTTTENKSVKMLQSDLYSLWTNLLYNGPSNLEKGSYAGQSF